MTKLRKSARGKDCTLRLDGCNFNPETTVLCHLPSASRGIGLKSPDWWAVYACAACHDRIDGRSNGQCEPQDVLRALHETQTQMIAAGLIVIK